MGMTYEQKIYEAKRNEIDIPKIVLEKRNLVGIYKFFYCEEDKSFCFYVGKSTNIADRLLGSRDGHIYMYLHNKFTKLVPDLINKYRKKGYKIKVEIKEIEYHDIYFTRAAHRLALAELQEIVKYQEKEQCLFQSVDCVGENEEKFWKDNYKIILD